MKMKRYLSSLMIIGLLSLLSACSIGASANTDKIVLAVGHIANDTHSYHLGLEEFGEALRDRTNGTVELEIYSNGQLGDERSMMEQVSAGSLDMVLGTTGVIGSFDKNMTALEFPFLFRDREHAYKVLDGEIGQDLLKNLDKINVNAIAFWENGFRQLSSSEQAIHSPEDMDSLNFRTVENDIFIQTYASWGAFPTPIAWPEVYTAIEQGVVSGLDNTIGALESSNMYEVQNYISLIDFSYAGAVLMINQDRFDSLPKDVQKAIVELGEEYKHVQRQINLELEEEQIKTMEEAGVTFVEKSDIHFEAFHEASQTLYDAYSSQYGELFEAIQAVD